ncbi:MAG: polysaccharide pyruvyl transferase CsaB [Oscillospiraceae bacterium]|nr:polysaccharide pyruvyl transferase CsaB [Oscillospiraceae bacterium]
MKIIHLISGGDGGGAKTHVFSLLKSLNKTESAILVCFRAGPFSDEAIALGIPTVIFSHKNIFKTFRELKKMVVREGIQIIHCHGSRGNMMGALLKHSLKLPVITTVHSDYQLDYMGRPLHRITYGVINSIALRRLDYRIGVSDAMVDLLLSRGFRPDRLFSIYNGIDFTPVQPKTTPEEYWKKAGLQTEEGCVVVGIAARLSPVKDIATLIRAFAMAAKKAPKLRLLIAGDGELSTQLKTLAEELQISGKICFMGWISDIRSFYQSIHINTLTSLSETFPYALTEGAREHLPTVASRVGGVPYLIDHGINGFLFPAGNAEALAKHLVTLAENPGLRRRFGEALYQKASTKFSLEATRLRQISIYETVLRRQDRAKKKRDGVLICGAYGRGNAGDDAILEAILIELRQINPDLPLWVLSRHPRSTQLSYRVNSIYTFSFLHFLYRMKKSVLYINGGGSLMQDITSRRSLWFYLYTIWTAKRQGCKVLMYGCGIGPINHKNHRYLLAKCLNQSVDIITLRDPHSLKELADLEVNRPEIKLSADPTVVLPPAPAPIIDDCLSQAGLKPDGKFICFTLRRWPGFTEKVSAFADAADYAYETYGLIPVFLPIESRMDLPASRQVAAEMKSPHVFLEEATDSGRVIGLLSRMQIVVSMRLHALVFAASQGVPLVGVVYDQKVSSFLSSIGQDLYQDLDKITAPMLREYIDRAIGRSKDTSFLQGAVARLVELEKENSSAAKRLLAGKE